MRARVFRTKATDLFASKKMRGGGAPTGATIWPCSAEHGSAPYSPPLPLARALRTERARLSALHRGTRHTSWLSPRPRFPRPGFGGRYPPTPVSVQRAPRRPVVVPDERDPRAARERFARPRAGTAPAPHLRSHPECVPSLGGLFVQLSHPSPLSRKNEFAFGAFVSN